MRIGELARRTGVTVKAIRYYESLGLVRPDRLENNYREYDEQQAVRIREIRSLAALGVTASRTRPFLDCLAAGNSASDDCPASLDAYRAAIADATSRIDELVERRDGLKARLAIAVSKATDAGSAPRCELVSDHAI